VRRAVTRLKRVTLSVSATVRGPRVEGGSARAVRPVTLVVAAKPPPLRATVGVRNKFFTPRNVRMRRGGTITWTWQSDGLPHDVAGPGFQSAVKSQGTYKRTFAAAGSFPYVCTLHDGMRGTITVR
jgi:plastocyanin